MKQRQSVPTASIQSCHFLFRISTHARICCWVLPIGGQHMQTHSKIMLRTSAGSWFQAGEEGGDAFERTRPPRASTITAWIKAWRIRSWFFALKAVAFLSLCSSSATSLLSPEENTNDTNISKINITDEIKKSNNSKRSFLFHAYHKCPRGLERGERCCVQAHRPTALRWQLQMRHYLSNMISKGYWEINK